MGEYQDPNNSYERDVAFFPFFFKGNNWITDIFRKDKKHWSCVSVRKRRCSSSLLTAWALSCIFTQYSTHVFALHHKCPELDSAGAFLHHVSSMHA